MDWSIFNWVDGLFVIVLLYGAGMGGIRGLSFELATVIGWAVAIVVTRLFYEPVADWICGQWGTNPEITRLVAVVVLVLAALFGMRALRIALGTLMDFSFKGPVERIGGLLTGMARRGLVFLVGMLVASFMPSSWLQRAVMIDSETGRTVLPHLVEGYNAMAEKAALIQAEIPFGVETTEPVMPPLPESTARESLEAKPLFGSE